MRGNEKNHFEAGITQRDGRRHVLFRRVVDGQAVGPLRSEEIGAGDVVLTVEASPLEYEFFYETPGGARRSLGKAATRDLSSEKVGGFTGVYVGMYATGNGKESTTPADFDWFEYDAGKE